MPSRRCEQCGAKITHARLADGTIIALNHPGEQRLVIDEDGIAHVFLTYISHLATCGKQR